MNFLSTIVNRISAFTGKAEQITAQEAAIPPAGITRDPGDGFRPITQQAERDLQPMSQERMIEIAYWLMETNPMARAIVGKFRDFLAGEGIGWAAKDENVDQVIQRFWYDPVNKFEQKLPQKIRQLFGFGEQCYPAFTSQFAGNVRLGYVDPASIKEVITDPENCEIKIGVILKNRGNKKGKRYKIIHDSDEELSSAAGQALRDTYTDGECFYFTINEVSNSSRGRSELLATADSLDGYEQFLFDRIDLRRLIFPIWDTKIEGKTEEEIKAIAKDMPAPKPGNEFVHNERITRTAVAPDMKADDATSDARLLKNHILAGHGLPPTWFAESGDVNRAAAGELDTATLKALTMAQLIVKDMIREMIRFQIRQKIAKGELEATVTLKDGTKGKAVDAFAVTSPEISTKDLVKLSAALQQITTSLMIAETQGWVSKKMAANAFANNATALGMEIEAADVGEPATGDGTGQVTEDYRSREALARSRRARGGSGARSRRRSFRA